jgi:hypothetical protein
MATLQQTVDRWASSAAGAEQKFKDGISGTTVDPTQLAIAAQGKLVAAFNESVSSGRWARNLAQAGKQKWQTNSLNKSSNWTTGISAGKDAYQAAMQVWLPIIDGIAQNVRAMPNNSFGDSIARMTAMATQLHNAKLSR